MGEPTPTVGEKPKERMVVKHRVLRVDGHPVIAIDLDADCDPRAADADAHVMAAKVRAINAAEAAAAPAPVFEEIVVTAKRTGPGEHEVTEVPFAAKAAKVGA